MLTNNVTCLTISGLDNYTEYEFQVLAFSSKGDGPKSSVVVERTKEDGKIFKNQLFYLATVHLRHHLNILFHVGEVNRGE